MIIQFKKTYLFKEVSQKEKRKRNKDKDLRQLKHKSMIIMKFWKNLKSLRLFMNQIISNNDYIVRNINLIKIELY